jgi:plastocyanin
MLVLVAGLTFAPSALGDTFRVKATDNNRWNPDFRHITRGDRIKWVNPQGSGRTHNVRSYGSNWNKSETLSPGESTRKRFRNNGTYKYRCSLHSTLINGNCNGMCGEIHVQGP